MSTSFSRMSADELRQRGMALHKQIGLSGGDTPANAPLIAELMSLRALARVERATRAQPPGATRVAPPGGTTRAASRPAAQRLTADPIREPRSIEPPNRTSTPTPWARMTELRGEPHRIGRELRNLALSAVERMPAASDQVRETLTRHLQSLERGQVGPLASIVLATSDPNYVAGWCRMIANPDMGRAAMTDSQSRAVDQANYIATSMRAMSLTDSAGGFMVPAPLDPGIVLQSGGSLSQIRRVARQVLATADVWRAPSATSAAWSYDSEATQVSDDSPTFGQPSIPIHTARGFVPLSIELFQDADNATGAITDVLARSRDDLEAQAFAVGTGSGQPKGIVTALSGTGSVVPAGTAGTVAADDLYAMLDALPARYSAQPSTAWLAAPATYSRARQLDGAGGAIPWLSAPSGPLLLDRPALVAEAMDNTLDATPGNDPALILGDFSNFVIVDRFPTVVEIIPHLFQQTTAGSGYARPTGQRGLYAMARHGSDVVNADAFRMLVA